MIEQSVHPSLGRMMGLRRFRRAQDPVIHRIVEELVAGQKRTHWMWFGFPQPLGLGKSPMSRLYGLSEKEAPKYMDDPVLSQRLTSMTFIVLDHAYANRWPSMIFGDLDAMKFASSVELFASITRADPFLEMFDVIQEVEGWKAAAERFVVGK
jgi:uncharacterized protein (DUF1810 family)